ncbi:MAG: TIGR00282 family metallophosphoesterase [bacterium]
MKILFIGDIVSSSARSVLKKLLPELRSEHGIDIVIANGEHLSDRVGVDAETVEEMTRAGIDFFTTGNHVWRQKDFADKLEKRNLPVIRPANFLHGTPGDGYRVINTSFGKLLVINLLGQHEIKTNATSPFLTADEIIAANPDCKYIFVDFHAEMSSEKVALGRYLDGRVSAVVGTHIHVPTADARVLSGGTAVVTDVGFTGPAESILGVREDIIFQTFISSMPQKFELADGPIQLNSVLIDLGSDGKAKSIIRIDKVVSV